MVPMHLPSNSRASRDSLWAAFAGGVSAILLTVLLRSLLGTKSLAEVALDGATDGPYPEAFSFLLRNLRDLAKPLFYASVLVAQLGVFMTAWRLTARIKGYHPELPLREIAAALLASAVFIGATLALELFFDARLGSQTSCPEYVAVTAVACGSFALVARLLGSWELRGSTEASSPARRTFLRKAPAIGVGIVGMYLLGREVR